MSSKEAPFDSRGDSNIELRAALAAAREFPSGNGANTDANRVIAKNILKTELGEFTEIQHEYHLDQPTRDRLLAHARHDAAHALLNTIDLMRDVQRLERQNRKALIAVVIFCILLALWIRWPL
jgi:hypothetical protein